MGLRLGLRLILGLGLCCVVLGCVRLCWGRGCVGVVLGLGLGWVGVGLGWVGLGWVGLGWVGLGWVGLMTGPHMHQCEFLARTAVSYTLVCVGGPKGVTGSAESRRLLIYLVPSAEYHALLL